MAKINIIEKIAAAPAVSLDKTVCGGQELVKLVADNEAVKTVEGYWQALGPGLTTGAADDDPSGIATYSQTGAAYGFNLLWLALFSFPLMATVQEMCARIGVVTGRGLASNIRLHYSKKVLYICTALLFAANSFNIGADLGAMAKATQLLLPGSNFIFWILAFTFLSLSFQIFASYRRYAKYLKWLSLILISYVLTALAININWLNVSRFTIIPHLQFNRTELFLVCGILGTTISPYLFFWQTSQEVEEQILDGKTSIKQRQEQTSKQDIGNMRLDVWTGMFFSNLVMFFIILTCGAVLFPAGLTNIATAAQAAAALKPLAGNYAFLLFAVGIIGIGLQAVPVLAGSCSYAIAEAMGWPHGLYRKLKTAHAFYGIIIISMFLGLGLNFVGLDPIKALIYAAVLNGIIAPIVLIPVVQISSKEQIMGRWKNGKAAKVLGWITVGVMAVAGAAAIVGIFL